MHFGNPTMFWLLALAPALIVFLVWSFRARRRALERFIEQTLAERLSGSVHRPARRWKAAMLVAAVLLAVLALTQPRWGFEWREVKRRGVDIFVLLDVSRSMLAEDVRPNRLAQAKFAVKDLLQQLEGDRVGLIAFAGTAFVQCPLTVDYEAFRLALNDADPRVIPMGGSAIGMAIRTALKGFEAGEGRDRAIVLITDGEDTGGDAVAAAEQAAQQAVRIYAIGVGTSDGELIPVREEGKPLEFLKDKEGKVVKSRLDEETLKQIALETEGIYVRSAAGDFGIDTIYGQGILQLRREEYEARLQKKYFERFQWPLGIAVALLAIEMFLTDRKRRLNHRGTENTEKMRKPPKPAAVLTLCALCFCGFHSASFADTAARLYDQGKYAEAFERYAKAAENAKNNWPLFYNLGAAAYKAGRLDEATQAFERAAGAPDPALQQKALYNLGNSWFRIGEAAEQQMPEQALPVYQRSLKSYESALALDPNDADAEYNRDVVKKKIEELQKQQEQQQQQNQDQKNEDKNKEENEEQQKQDSQNQSQQQQEQPQQQPEEKQTQEQQSQQQEQPGEKEQPPPPQPGQTNHFEQFQARVLLDNLREDERNWNFFPELQMELQEAGEPEKDW